MISSVPPPILSIDDPVDTLTQALTAARRPKEKPDGPYVTRFYKTQ